LQILGLLFFYQYIAPPSAGCPPVADEINFPRTIV
jgi:hypothetical protein